MKNETSWQMEELSLPAMEQQLERQRRVKFDNKIKYYHYDVTFEDHSEVKYNRFIKELWRKHNEVSKQIEYISRQQHSQVPPKQQLITLNSILEKLLQQEKRIIDCLSDTPGSLMHTQVIEEEIRLQEEEGDTHRNTLSTNLHDIEQYEDEQNDESNEQIMIKRSMTAAQKAVLTATEKSSTPHIMTQLEIVRKDIDSIISTAIENQHFLATQLTNDSAKTKELLKLTSSKRINEERKWHKITERVGSHRANEMKNYIKAVDEEARVWWKERQEKLSLAENLMVTVNKEQSVNCRKQMVKQRPELAREIVLVEAARILSFIKVKQPQNTRDFSQWLDEQYSVLATKMSTAQADSVMQEVYSKLPIETTLK